MIGHRVALRPRSFAEIGDLAFVLLRLHWRSFALLLPWVVVPAAIGWLLQTAAGWFSLLALGISWASVVLLSNVYTPLCGDLMLQPKTSLKSVQRRFLSRLPAYAAAKIGGWLFVALFGWAVVPYSLTVFAPEGVLLERGSMASAWSRSAALSRAAPGRAVMFGLLGLLLTCAATVACEALHCGLRELMGLAAEWDLTDVTWADYLGLALIQPYLVALRFLLYIDCRTRREGWDLQVQFSALVTAAQSPLRHRLSSTEAA